eukprot:gene4114-5615_t
MVVGSSAGNHSVAGCGHARTKNESLMSLMPKSFAATLACVMSLIAAAPAMAAPIPAGPAGDAFYTPPSPLPSGKRGSVIWTRPLDGTMALPSAAQNSLVLYRSSGAAGGTVAVSGTLSIPKGDAPAGGWPVIVWTHGTTGLAAACAPSRDTDSGPEHAYIAVIRTLLDSYVKQGYAVVASDYEGLGVAGNHPFLQGVPTGRNALDMLRAGREIAPSLGTSYTVVGHSQGGQVDRIAKLVPNHPTDPWTLERALNGVSELAQEYRNDDGIKRLLDLAMKLEGLPRHSSTHAAGVVIGDRPLAQLVPLYRDPRSDMPVTQFDMKYVESAGLVKFDFLGLK